MRYCVEYIPLSGGGWRTARECWTAWGARRIALRRVGDYGYTNRWRVYDTESDRVVLDVERHDAWRRRPRP